MYVIISSYGTQPKNQLERDFADYLISLNRSALIDPLLEKTKQMILSKYDELAKKHNRCKPKLKFFTKNNEDKKDETICLQGTTAYFFMYKATFDANLESL